MLTIRFGAFPVITTGRLILRQFATADAQALFELRSDPAVMRFIGKPLAKSADEMGEFIQRINNAYQQNEGIGWAVTLKDSLEMIGTIGFHRIDKEHHRGEIGYLLKPAQQRKGLIHEAMTPVLEYGFSNIGLHSIEANVDGENSASIKVLERNQFKREAHFRENYYFEGVFLDSVIYSLIYSPGAAAHKASAGTDDRAQDIALLQPVS